MRGGRRRRLAERGRGGSRAEAPRLVRLRFGLTLRLRLRLRRRQQRPEQITTDVLPPGSQRQRKWALQPSPAPAPPRPRPDRTPAPPRPTPPRLRLRRPRPGLRPVRAVLRRAPPQFLQAPPLKEGLEGRASPSHPSALRAPGRGAPSRGRHPPGVSALLQPRPHHGKMVGGLLQPNPTRGPRGKLTVPPELEAGVGVGTYWGRSPRHCKSCSRAMCAEGDGLPLAGEGASEGKFPGLPPPKTSRTPTVSVWPPAPLRQAVGCRLSAPGALHCRLPAAVPGTALLCPSPRSGCSDFRVGQPT